MKYFWIINGDISSCFDAINHRKLMKLLGRRVRDGDLLDLIWSLLRAGVMERQLFKGTNTGTPQGGIVSPLLANVYLHELGKFMRRYTDFPIREKDKRRKAGCRFRPERVPLSRRVVPTPPGSILVAPNALHPCAEGVWGDKKGDTPMSQVVPSWPKKWYPRRPLPTGWGMLLMCAMPTTVRQAMSVRDEGRSLGAGLRRQAPNHRERLGSRAPVVSVSEKARPDRVRCGSERRPQGNH